MRQVCLVYDNQHPMGAAARELKNIIMSKADLSNIHGDFPLL